MLKKILAIGSAVAAFALTTLSTYAWFGPFGGGFGSPFGFGCGGFPFGCGLGGISSSFSSFSSYTSSFSSFSSFGW